MKYSKFIPKWAKNQDHSDEPEFVPHGSSYPDEELPDDYDLGINPVTGDKMGSKYSGLCMHPGCYQVVSHGRENVCGQDHGGGRSGCGKYFCKYHLILTDICRKCWNEYWSKLFKKIQESKTEDSQDDATRVSSGEGAMGEGKVGPS